MGIKKFIRRWIDNEYLSKESTKNSREIIKAIDAAKAAHAADTAEIIKAIEKQTRAITWRIDCQSDVISFQFLPERTLEFVYEGQPIRLYIPSGDFDHLQSAILRGRTFYEEAILRRIKDTFSLGDKTVVDVGANIGNHTVYFAAVCGAAECISFEPNPYAASILRRNAELNHLDNVTVRQLAISDKPGTLSFGRYRPRNLGATSYEDADEGKIPAMRLDDVGLSRVDFLKVDVEGMGNRVLEGARGTLARFKPPILIEMFEDEYETCAAILASLGYRQDVSLELGNYIFSHPQA